MIVSNFLQLFVDFFKENKTLVVANILFLFLLPIEDILLPHLYGKAIDMFSSKNRSFTPFLYLIIVLSIIQAMYFFGNYHNAMMIPKLESFLRQKILNTILEKYEVNHKELETGDIISRIIRIPSVMKGWFYRVKDYFIPYMITFLFASIYFLYYDFQLGLGLIVLLIIYVYTLVKSPAECSKRTLVTDLCFNKIHEEIDDVFRNMYSVYGGNQQSNEMDRIKHLENDYSKFVLNTMKCVLKQKGIVTPFIIAYLIFFIIRLYNLVNTKKLSISNSVSIFMIMTYILNIFFILSDQIREIVYDWGVIQTSADIITPLNNKKTTSISVDLPQTSGLGLHNVSFVYPGTDNYILKNFSLHINYGERICIVGDIGSGKSTILKLLLKYSQPTFGYLYWDGRNYDDIPITTLRNRIGYVPQVPVLFNRSVIDNILYGNLQYKEEYVLKIMDMFGIKDDFIKLNQGIYTKVGKNGSKISGGQRQLIWCLRVLLSKPDILILDEPTASVDSRTKEKLAKMINYMMQDKTVIMVTHDEYLLKFATRTIQTNKESTLVEV